MNKHYFYTAVVITVFYFSSPANAVIYNFNGYISATSNLSLTYSSLQKYDLFSGTFSYSPLLNSNMNQLPESFGANVYNLNTNCANIFISSGQVNINVYLPVMDVIYNSSDNSGPDKVYFSEPLSEDHRFYLEDSKGALISSDFDLTDNFADYAGDFIFCDTISRIQFTPTYISAQPVPEPATFLLICAGLLGIVSMKKKFRV